MSSDGELMSHIEEVCRLLSERGREHWWVKKEYVQQFLRNGFHILAAGFYTPLPSEEDVEKISFENEYFPLEQIKFRAKASVDLLDDVLRFLEEMAFPDEGNASKPEFYWNNDQFRGLDAIAYYGLIRKYKPSTIIEVGAGFSSIIASAALKKNGKGKLILIEPYPSARLRNLGAELIVEKIQDVDPPFFDQLEHNDFLFIDSSHCAYTQSDVHHEIFNIVPRLKSGVKLHFHDIFFPFEYPADWLKGGWRWNEQYLVYALLLMNEKIAVTLPIFNFWHDRALLSGTKLENSRMDWQYGQSLWLEIQ